MVLAIPFWNLEINLKNTPWSAARIFHTIAIRITVSRYFIFIFVLVYKINTNPGPGAYESLSPRIAGPSIKRDVNPRATMMSRIPLKNVPGP